jgi:hypothetical protein
MQPHGGPAFAHSSAGANRTRRAEGVEARQILGDELRQTNQAWFTRHDYALRLNENCVTAQRNAQSRTFREMFRSNVALEA